NCPSGNNISQTGTAPNPWHIQGSYYDSSTGTQVYLGSGIYDSTIARWNDLRFAGEYLSNNPALQFDAAALSTDVAALSLSVYTLPESGPLGVAGALIAGG